MAAAAAPKRKGEIDSKSTSSKKSKRTIKHYTEKEYNDSFAAQRKEIEADAETYTMVPYRTGNTDHDANRQNETAKSRKAGESVIDSRALFTINQLTEQLTGRREPNGEIDEDEKVQCPIERMRIHLRIVFDSLIGSQSFIIDFIMLYALTFDAFTGKVADYEDSTKLGARLVNFNLCRALHPTDPMLDRTKITLLFLAAAGYDDLLVLPEKDMDGFARLTVRVEFPPDGFKRFDSFETNGQFFTSGRETSDEDRSVITWCDDRLFTCLRWVDFCGFSDTDGKTTVIEEFDDFDCLWEVRRPERVPHAHEQASGQLIITRDEGSDYISTGSHLSFYADSK